MVTCRDCPGRITMPEVPADSEVSFGNEVLAAYMSIGLSNSCTSRPALYTERVRGAEARTRTRSGVNRKSSAVRDTDCFDPSHARRAETARQRRESLVLTVGTVLYLDQRGDDLRDSLGQFRRVSVEVHSEISSLDPFNCGTLDEQ
jgi:hypothetical protein